MGKRNSERWALGVPERLVKLFAYLVSRFPLPLSIIAPPGFDQVWVSFASFIETDHLVLAEEGPRAPVLNNDSKREQHAKKTSLHSRRLTPI